MARVAVILEVETGVQGAEGIAPSRVVGLAHEDKAELIVGDMIRASQEEHDVKIVRPVLLSKGYEWYPGTLLLSSRPFGRNNDPVAAPARKKK